MEAGMALALFFAGLLLLAIVSIVLRSFRRPSHQQDTLESAAAQAHGFPVIAQPVLPVDAADDGPGRYRVVGVVQDTLSDVKLYVEAETLANAKVKAELRGVVVTEIAKV
jgi:hypothetical protein